jgi:hypothetical protein
MTKENEIEVNGVKYLRKDSVKSQKEFNGKTKIVILQRGWIMVGKLERKGAECKLHNASVIRTWGTTKGIGEIAENGVTATTKLDKCFGVVEFDYLTVVATIACNELKWKDNV